MELSRLRAENFRLKRELEIMSASNMKCNTCREVKCCDGNELRTSEL
jgi:hypothetical protein